ncbi:MAG: FAD-linked oxidase C-terminal domain-containing protein [Planctomycetota bacterium]
MGASVVRELTKLLSPGQVASDPAAKKVYESDGFTIARGEAACVVFPESTAQVVATVRKLGDLGVQLVPRGSGTGLAGGCVAFDGGVVISTARLGEIHAIDLDNRVAHVEAGVRNTQLSDAVAAKPGGERFHFAPDPSSQRASTIGGNAATNAGGVHTLKDFVSSNHILGVELVTPDGEVLRVGAHDGRYVAPGPDLAGLVCGSEGTLGIITSLWVRLVPKATHYRTVVATFPSQRAACDTVSDIIADGFLPAALEMMDGRMVQLVNETFNLGIDAEARALLLIEIDGIAGLLDAEVDDLRHIAAKHGALSIDASGDPARRQQLWKARKAAFGAIGKISPSYCTQDACVPRSRLAEVLAEIDRIGQRFGLSINNVFHAGDGNIHPIFLYDDQNPTQIRHTLEAAEEVLKFCIDLGGTLTGEHGVGVEKLHLMPYMFDGETLTQFDAVKAAFDPNERMNAGKLLPSETVNIDLLEGVGRKVPQ